MLTVSLIARVFMIYRLFLLEKYCLTLILGSTQSHSDFIPMELTSVAGIMVVLANLFGIVRTLRSTATGQNKAMWVAIILLVPFVGVVAWILFGPS